MSPTTSTAALDAAVAQLQASKDRWAALPPQARRVILEEVRRDFLAIAADWVTASLEAKGFSSGGLAEAEEWLFTATILRAMRLLRQSLVEIERHGRVNLPGPFVPNQSGQLVAQVFPSGLMDRLLYQGLSGEVWLEPDVTPEAAVATSARWRGGDKRTGRVVLVLGAGNASMLPVIDTLHKLFVEDQVVLLKPNPVNAYLGPLLEKGFQALIARGFLRLVYGDQAEGSYLAEHPGVDELHLTGSIRTFEAITFGSGVVGERRKQAQRPLLSKRFTCELGNISPVIVVPGPWSAAEIADQASQIATWLVANAGFGCLTPRLLIQMQDWPQRHALNHALEQCLATVETRPAYYPGAAAIQADFVAAHPQARQIGQASGDRLPWTFIPDVDPEQPDDICFTREAFCGLLAETALPALSPIVFLEKAVAFANESVWGTLCATLIVHPASLNDPLMAAAVAQAIADLHYGAVVVNQSPFAAYYLLATPWGGFPGRPLNDVQSGLGKTGNVLMLDKVQKSVVYAPFHKKLDAIRVTARRPHQFCRQLAFYEASRAIWRLPGLAWAALRSQAVRGS
jgi:acyl-CoA reductase-like NAD-dependent aldehyde dehydrogenase